MVIDLPAHGYSFCRSHYEGWFLRRISWTMKELCGTTDRRILVALSGGLDSAVLCHALKAAGVFVDAVVEIDVPDEEIVRRMSGRWSHPASGRRQNGMCAFAQKA